MNQLLALVSNPLDLVGLVLFLLVFPVYHALYPLLVKLFADTAARTRFDEWRESWIQGLIERRDIMAAAQQTRNLTMVNTVLVSSSLILIGFIANFLLQLAASQDSTALPAFLSGNVDALRVKLYMLILTFALAFSFFMTSLRHLGHFVLVVGADPALIERYEGKPSAYLSRLINRASHRYTLGVRSFYAAFPLFAWLFDPWMFLLLTIFWAVKFVGFQDFSHVIRKR